ncbi:MAG: site-specific DNA-methyltransferase [Chloroflexales bacterium]|nr:site-specific DNA-methyltransferase [Chloroflexales bacterium]
MVSYNVASKPGHPNQNDYLTNIEVLDYELEQHFQPCFVVQPALTRSLVSFQANKVRPVYRWYKYKEAFSASLVEYLFRSYDVEGGRVLDPFAGSGTALFAASELGIDSEGIELLPIGQQIIATKKLIDSGISLADLKNLKHWASSPVWEQSQDAIPLPELRITKGAYPENTKQSIEKYLAAVQKENETVRSVLFFALLCILESTSYTRKDGQYLRWDYRSGRKQGKKIFDKGEISSFKHAISDKLSEIIGDIAPTEKQTELFTTDCPQGSIELHNGSCLEIMPTLPSNMYDAIITSPPYCNRYDYTRTYALELALLGINEGAIVDLRQAMLSCTVENRAKDLLAINPAWRNAISVADEQRLLQLTLSYLEKQRDAGLLNNNGIPRMVRGYFYEMACIISECARVMKSGASLFMVNDNVRYAGASVSVDTILSDFAEHLGFTVEKILVLPNGKGNSSQQMGEHGREALRKCVYVWKKI